MAVKKWKSTGSKGIRYYEHPTRKHGNVAKDRYFAIRYSVDGKRVEEGIGWDTEWAAARKKALDAAGDNDETKKAKAKSKNAKEEAELRITELKENRRKGEGHRTLREKRALDDTDRQEKAMQEEKEVRDRLTFQELADGQYIEERKKEKHKELWRKEISLLSVWINPVIGSIPLKTISLFHLKKIKANMAKAGRAPRTAHYALAVVRQVFNYAIDNELFNGVNPVIKKKLDLPKIENRRERFLTRKEAAALLAELATKSPDTHDMALLSLHTGMRAGEIFSLKWHDVDVERGILSLRNTKSGKPRAAFMTEAVKGLFSTKERGAPSGLVFLDRNGNKIKSISNTYHKAVKKLKLNEGIEDHLMRVVFHTLRHTYASWHVENGTDLYTVKELLGHADLKMTARYSHLGENTLQAAVKRLDSTLQTPDKVVPMVKRG